MNPARQSILRLLRIRSLKIRPQRSRILQSPHLDMISMSGEILSLLRTRAMSLEIRPSPMTLFRIS